MYHRYPHRLGLPGYAGVELMIVYIFRYEIYYSNQNLSSRITHVLPTFVWYRNLKDKKNEILNLSESVDEPSKLQAVC